MKHSILMVFATLFFITTGFASEEGRRFIFHEGQGVVLLKPCSRIGVSDFKGTWSPTIREVDELEARFTNCISHSELKPLGTFNRQYVGFKRGETRFIYLSAFSSESNRVDPSFDIRKPERICDGTSSVFGIEYEVSRKSFGVLRFNGPKMEKTTKAAVDSCGATEATD